MIPRDRDLPPRLVLLYDLPDEIMLIVEHPSGVRYQNQTGGVTCDQPVIEGVLAPIDVSPAGKEAIENLMGLDGRLGLTPEMADTMDALLASERCTSWLRVDRERMHASQEAWIYVLIASPETSHPGRVKEPYFGSIFGFGAARGVLTWINSD